MRRIPTQRLRVIPAALCLAVWFQTVVLALPTETELVAKLHLGMSMDEAASAFGSPLGERIERGDSVRMLYHASPNELTDDREGYAGFELHFVNGTLIDYRILRERPSFRSNLLMPSEMKWMLWVFGVLTVAFLILVSLVRRGGIMLAQKGIFETYRWREIASDKIPSGFRFITHDTTLGRIIAELGAPSRLLELPVSPDFPPGISFITTNSGRPALVVAEYKLPYGAPVYVMPEYPFDQSSRIRAVFQGDLPIESLGEQLPD